MNPKSLSLYEHSRDVQGQIFNIQNHFFKGDLAIEEIGEYLPGSVMVQDLSILSNAYMNQRGCEILGKSQEELAAMGDEYFERFFPPEEMVVLLAELKAFASLADISCWHSFFQRVSADPCKGYDWYLTTSRLYKPADNKEGLFMMHIALPLKGLSCSSKRLQDLTGDSEYIRRNIDKYRTLSQREKQIIALIAEGKSSREISDELFRSIHTINNHRKSIIHKLGDRSLYNLMKFAEAFGII